MTKPEILDDQPDFSLVLGGPLFQMWRRTHLSGAALELVRRRVVVIAGVAWLPLLLLSVIGGHALGGTIKVPFLHDIEAHARFLIALPILIGAELIVHFRIPPAVRRFWTGVSSSRKTCRNSTQPSTRLRVCATQ